MVTGESAGDELRRRRGSAYDGTANQRGEERGEDVQEDRELTLST